MDNKKYYLAVEPTQPSQPQLPFSADTAWQIGAPFAITTMLILINVWLTSRFVGKEYYIKDQVAIAARFDLHEKSTDNRLDKLSVETAEFRAMISLVLSKMDAYTEISTGNQENLYEKFNNLKASVQDSLNANDAVFERINKKLDIANSGLESISRRVSRLQVLEAEIEKENLKHAEVEKK